MKVLVLGSTGYIGRKLLVALQGATWAEATGASRTKRDKAPAGDQWVMADTCDLAALTQTLKGFDTVVNCVAGDGRSISEGAHTLSRAASDAGCRRIIHMSTMSVYGNAEGLVAEDFPLVNQVDWYGEAKRNAETHMQSFAASGGEAVILRPGCVFGPGSEQWVGRLARWLRSGRLGDLGAAGDGWSNLVHVKDVCQAILAAIRFEIKPGQATVFNLAAPDSPRWNEYFVALAMATGATPVRRIAARQLRMDSLLAGPPLKIAEKLLKRAGWSASKLPEAISPGLLRLWAQQIRLDSTQTSQKLKLDWTPYPKALQSAGQWFSGR